MPDLPVFIATDQPEQCRACGARTEFAELDNGTQKHTCPACGFSYVLVFEK